MGRVQWQLCFFGRPSGHLAHDRVSSNPGNRMPHLTAAETPNHIQQIMNKCVVLEAIIILRFVWRKSWGIIRRNNSYQVII